MASTEQERATVTTQEGRRQVSANDWVMTFTYDADPSVETLDSWESQLEDLEASVSRVPERDVVNVTIFISAPSALMDAAAKMADVVGSVVGAEPIGAEVLQESEWERRAEAPTMPELMSAAEIADELGVSRQRVHQLRDTAAFPAPLVELRGGAVWDAAAVRKFDQEWQRKPGRPAAERVDVAWPHRPVTVKTPDLHQYPAKVSPIRSVRSGARIAPAAKAAKGTGKRKSR